MGITVTVLVGRHIQFCEVGSGVFVYQFRMQCSVVSVVWLHQLLLLASSC